MPKITGTCVGESLVGEGNEVAHVDLLLGPRGSAVETAYCIGLTNNKDGFTTLLALVAPNLMCKPPGVNVETGNRPITVFSNERDLVCLFSFRHCCTIRDKVRYRYWRGRRGARTIAERLSCSNER